MAKNIILHHPKKSSSTGNKHGLSGTPTYRTWLSMIHRCQSNYTKGYSRYGGSGINVCDRWKESVLNFVEDMGIRPNGTTLDRIDNKADYCKENCRWSTNKQQHRNKRSNILLTHNGKTACIAEWSEITGFSHSMILKRIKRGWSHSEALTRESTTQPP